MPNGTTAKSYGHYIFRYLGSRQVVFQSSCTFLHFYQQNISDPSFGVVTRFYFSHCNSCVMIPFTLHFPNASHVEFVFMCLFSNYISSWVKCLFVYFTHFLTGFLNCYSWLLKFFMQFRYESLDEYIICCTCFSPHL